MTSLTIPLRRIKSDNRTINQTGESVMKTFTTFLTAITVLVFCVDVFANEVDQKIEKAKKAYGECLNTNVNGVIESTIINVMKMKAVYPDYNYSSLAKKLEKLSFDGPTQIIRYKAYIAANYLKHPERFSWIKADSYEEMTKFFALYESRLGQQLDKLNLNLVASAENE